MRFAPVLVPALLLLPWLPCAAQDPPADGARTEEAVLKELRDKRVSFEFHEAPFDVVARYFGEITGGKFAVHPALAQDAADRGRTVSLRLRDIPVLDALDVFLRFAGAKRTFCDGCILAMDPWASGSDTRTVFYSLDRVCARLDDFPGDERDLFEACRPPGEAMPPMMDEFFESICPEDVVDMIRDSVAPDSWDSDGRSVTFLGGALIVNHGEDAHREIRKVLATLEAAAGPPIVVHAEILRLPDGALDPFAGRARISADETARLRAAAAGPGDRRSFSLSLRSAQRNHIASGSELPFTVETEGGVPLTATVRDGTMLDVQASCVLDDAVPSVVRFFHAPEAVLEGGRPAMPVLQCLTVASIPLAGSLLLAAGTVPQAGGPPRLLAVLLRAEAGQRPDLDALWNLPPDPATEAAKAILRTKLLSVDFMDTPLPQVLDFLSEAAGVNLLLDPTVLDQLSEDELLVQLRVAEIPAESVLRLILELKGLGISFVRGVGVVTMDDGTPGETRLAHMPVHDLTAFFPHFPLPRRGLPVQGPPKPMIFVEDSDEEPITGDTLVNMVRELVAVESWDTPPNQVGFRQNCLIVRNRPEVIEQVRGVIQGLRARVLRGVVVRGTFLRASRPWLDALDLEGPALTPEQCARVEAALGAPGVEERERFRVQGLVGRTFGAKGGRQRAVMGEWRAEHSWRLAAVEDGWVFQGTATAGQEPGRVFLDVAASASTYLPPEDPGRGIGALEAFDFKTSVDLADGGGVILGAASSGGGAGADRLLFLRAWKVE